MVLNRAMAAKAEIVVRPLTEITQAQDINLAEVVEIHGQDSLLARKLSLTKLSGPLQVGERLEFTGEAISSLLRSQITDQQDRTKLNILIPNKVVVENIGQKATENRVRKELIDRWGSECSCRVEIEDLILPHKVILKANYPWKLRLSSERERGTFTLPLEFTRPDGQVQTLWVRGRVSYFKKVPVAQKILAFGERLQAGDFRMEERNITFVRDGWPSEEDELIGKKLRQSIVTQEIITMGLLEKEKALHRGDEVKISLGNTDWEVGLIGIAEQDAFVGDRINVRHAKSKQIISVRVIGQGEVRLE